MPFLDTATILGGPDQSIDDWYWGDDREFSGNVSSLINPADPNITDAYFTLKENPSAYDQDAILMIHITTLASPGGQITGAPASALFFHVASPGYQDLVRPSVVYYWDFRGITAGGSTITFAEGSVAFLQNVTRRNVTGIPAPVPPPKHGQPRFRGFMYGPPAYGIFNTGDWVRNAAPQPGTPSGWACAIGGMPGTWYSDGIVGDDAGAVSVGAPGTSSVPQYRGAAPGPPAYGQYNQGDWVKNSTPLPGYPSGWVCIDSGAPGIWVSDGIVGDDVGI